MQKCSKVQYGAVKKCSKSAVWCSKKVQSGRGGLHFTRPGWKSSKVATKKPADGRCVTHFQFVKKMLSKGCEPSGRTVKIVSVQVLRRDRHTIKNQKIAGRTAEWCRLFWEEDGGGVREENVDCVRVRLKELNSAYWEHVSSFLLGDCMGVRHRKGFFDE